MKSRKRPSRRRRKETTRDHAHQAGFVLLVCIVAFVVLLFMMSHLH